MQLLKQELMSIVQCQKIDNFRTLQVAVLLFFRGIFSKKYIKVFIPWPQIS